MMHGSFRRIFLRSVLLFCLFAAAPAGCAGQEAGEEADLPLGRRISNCGEVIRGLRENVRYDKVHGKNPNTHLKATAYSALVLRTATCQGYSAALYRLLREEGVECRAVTGQAGGETLHAWILVRLGDRFYLLDPTYDAGQEEWKHYLLGRDESEDHVPEERFRTEEFLTRYPMAEKAYSRK